MLIRACVDYILLLCGLSRDMTDYLDFSILLYSVHVAFMDARVNIVAKNFTTMKPFSGISYSYVTKQLL